MEKRIKQLGKIFFLSTGVMASAAMLTACSQEMAAPKGGSGDGAKVEVTASFVEPKQALTRAADGLDVASGFSLNTSTNSSSKVRVMVDQNDGEYAQFDYDITGNVPTKTISKESGAPTFNSGVNTVNVYGWYPAKSLSGFAVVTDQSTDANYCLSDLMVASGTTCTRSGSTVTHAANLSFTHVMAKLKVTLNPAANVNVKAVKLKSMATTVSLTETKSGNTVTGFSGYALGSASGSSDIDLHKSTDANITSASSAADKVLCGVFPAQSKNGALLEVTANYNGGSDVVITYSFSSAKDFTDGNEYGIDITLNETALQTTAVSLDTWDPSGNATITVGGGGGALALQTSSSGSNGYVTFSSIADCLYTGSAFTPEPSVTVKINNVSIPLTKDTDFEYSYLNNTNEGVATVQVTGKGLFSGTVSTTFNISACQGAALSTATVGSIICSHGKVHAATSSDLTTCSGHKVAIVAYKGSAGSADKSTGSSSYVGLALAITDVGGATADKIKWYTANEGTCITEGQSSDWATASGSSGDFMKGIDNTNRLATAACGSGHDHAAAKAAVDYDNTDAHPSGCSQWFLPTIAQWKLMLEAITGGTLTTSSQEAFKNTAFQSWFDARGGKNFEAGTYWCSVEYNTSSAWYMGFTYGYAYNVNKGSTYRVRPVLAF